MLIIAVGICVGLTGAVLWLAGSGDPARLPSDLDLTEVSAGTLTFFVDPEAPMPTAPREFPLTVRRRLHAVQSSGSTATVAEEETQTAGTVLNWSLQHAYVVDRRSLLSVADDRAYAYASENAVDRSPYYAVGVPADAAGGSYRIWQNETGTACAFSVAGADVPDYGIGLRPLTCRLAAVPVHPYFVDQLAGLGLPRQLALEQIAPQLVGAGIDLQRIAAAVLPHLSTSDRSAIRAILAQPIDLHYVVDIDRQLLAEPRTGCILDARTSRTVSVQLDLGGVSKAQGIFTKSQYATEPAVVAAVATLRRLIPRAPTIPVFTASYSQTPQSVSAAARHLAANQPHAGLAGGPIPAGLLGAGFAIAALGTAAGLAARRRQAQGGS